MKISRDKFISIIGVIILGSILTSAVYSHCQIPCGIYDDGARFDAIAEHIKTVEKSMNQITEISATEKPDYNQLVRWVNNKDDHADKIAEIVSYYFMAQRVKPADKSDAKSYGEYVNKITLLHEMLVYSMKCKQTTDLANVGKLRMLLAEFKTAYMAEHKH
jgi:nickel superoxide dismutase